LLVQADGNVYSTRVVDGEKTFLQSVKNDAL